MMQVSLFASDAPNGVMECTLDYSKDLFEHGSMERMAKHMVVLMEQVVGSPAEVQVQCMRLMEEAEAAMVLEQWNDTGEECVGDATAPELFEAQAMRTPDAVALVFEGARLTYKEAYVRSGRLACRLQSLGVCADAVVGLCVEKSMEEVLGMVGIMRAGGAYVPLDPKLPLQRLEYLVEQCGCSVVVVQEKHAEYALQLRGVLHVVVAEEAMEEGASDVVKAGLCNGGSLAYVLFTSGSTGKPKGVMVEQQPRL